MYKQTILILGGYGFLGTNILKHIDNHLRQQYQVIVFDKFAKHPHGVSFECVQRVYAGDFMNSELLACIFEENKIDLVIHSLSTTVPVDSSNARYDVESNLLPTIDILNLMVKYNVKDIVYLSSGGAIYGTQRHERHKETDDVFPISSYGVIKHTIEKYLMQYAQLYGLRPLILRLSNPYGEYHYSMKQGVVNVAMTKAINGEKMQIWGDGNGKKDYIYVGDFIEILFKLLSKKIHTQVINIASNILLSVNEIVQAVQTLEPNFQVEHIDADKYDTNCFALDTKKLYSLIGDYNFTPLFTGLETTYKWTKENL